jgi:tubulin beta
MREVVTIQVGQCGNQIGSTFWEVVSEEHALRSDGQFSPEEVLGEQEVKYYKDRIDVRLQRMDVFFQESQGGRFVPR